MFVGWWMNKQILKNQWMNRFSEMRVIRAYLVLSSLGLCSQGERLQGKTMWTGRIYLAIISPFQYPERDGESQHAWERRQREQRDERREARSEENGSLFLCKSSFPISLSSQSTIWTPGSHQKLSSLNFVIVQSLHLWVILFLMPLESLGLC